LTKIKKSEDNVHVERDKGYRVYPLRFKKV